MPEIPLFLCVIHFNVGKGRFAMGTPVYYTASSVNEFLIVEIDENFPYGFGALFVHGKGKARPVAGRTELFELVDYP